MEQQELSSIAGGMQNGTISLEDSLAVSYKTKYTLTILSRNHIPWYLPEGVENLNPHKNPDVFAALFIIAKTWKQPKYPSEGKWISKL